jgi:hypothetical protein
MDLALACRSAGDGTDSDLMDGILKELVISLIGKEAVVI